MDLVISRIPETGYAHHIERLMVLGNAMSLLRVHPDEVYQWFMEMFIDAYDWVMVPNVYDEAKRDAYFQRGRRLLEGESNSQALIRDAPR